MTKTPEELTKDWKEGKLKQGWYFTSTAKGEVCPNLWFDDEWNDFMGMVEEVLAPCDYDEYKAMQDHILYLEKCISIYEQKEKQHTNDSIEYNKLEKENNNLRALLRECKPYLSYKINKDKHVGFTPTAANLLTRINAAIGESEE